MSEAPERPQSDDELFALLETRLIDEGVSPERAKALAGALVNPESRLAALAELEDRLHRLSDVVERLTADVEQAAHSLDAAERVVPPAAIVPPAEPPVVPSPPGRKSSAGHHPVRAVEHEVEHLRAVANEGESPATPAILAGGLFTFLVTLIAMLIALAFAVGYVATRGGGSSTAPAFSAEDLTSPPTDSWITNGGTVHNQRYSSLTEIDTTNVSRLRGVWRTHLRGSGAAAKYSAEAQPLVYDGTIYQATGADDVFAVDVDTGEIKWQYEAKLSPKISTICCGWLSRGVALGEGKVYIGQLDGKLVALNQDDGTVAWSTQVARWQDGYTITAAPLYFDGRVITGVAGGEFGIRGRVTAFDASTGKEVWRFYTIPGPRETGHDTWPHNDDTWKTGGASVWQTPAVDPALGLLYFSTGNASPDLDGSRRAGDNLFASSMVAVDAKTGKYRWHFQQVHHDVWDYDAPSPVVLFDIKVGGRTRHAIAETGKTGWTYFLDRETGKPLYGISERPVKQSARQKTAKTQPIPSYPPVAPHRNPAKALAVIRQQAKQNAKGGKVLPVVNAPFFTPPVPGSITVATPGAQGGNNWQPMSYSPKTQMLYVCTQSGSTGYTMETKPTAHEAGKIFVGSIFSATGFGQNPGQFTAVDVRSGRIVWQKRWADSCYSGSAVTGGNVVFVGRNDGRLQAYDARNGKPLWSFQTGAGANSTATIFERDDTEYLAFYSGGNALAGTTHGDSLWLFSLDGTLGPVAGGGGGTAESHAGESPPPPAPPPSQGSAAAGQSVFASNCSGCHGTTGHGGNGGPDLTSIPSAKDIQRVIQQVTNGGGGMPSFKGSLTEQQIEDVATYVTSKITNGR